MKIKYFYDPLCGWCYGASPALKQAEASGIPVESLFTGFFAGANGKEMTPDFAAYAWENDQRIQKITGQPFSIDYQNKVLSNYSSRFDSWKPTLAIAAHETKFKGKALDILRVIQKARYVDALDVTNEMILADIAANLGWNRPTFLDLLQKQDFQNEVHSQVNSNIEDFSQYNASGIPLVIIEIAGNETVVTPALIFTKHPDPMSWPERLGLVVKN